ncbi:hypothetical protein MOQ_005548 [Trypanosoma cruzi marinkellei]|uniref:Uncharacterized protein n=1 Tax=Trypanosoma cruzi marinkellei TaxID=85056 RepID=K2M6T4_TRYCR|nr:hypothetical protein MOQ_005548 [Trypanosoma cruzi marinkellei]
MMLARCETCAFASLVVRRASLSEYHRRTVPTAFLHRRICVVYLFPFPLFPQTHIHIHTYTENLLLHCIGTMSGDESAPRTTAERLRAARRRETALLYEQSFDRRRCSFVRDPPCLGRAPISASSVSSNAPLVQQNKDTQGQCNSVSAQSEPHETVTARDCNVHDSDSLPITLLARPLKVLDRNWSGYSTPRRPDWCMYGAGTHTPKKNLPMHGVTTASRKPPLLLRPSSAATTTRSNLTGGLLSNRATSRLLTTPRDRPYSSSSSLMTHNTTISTAATVMTMAAGTRRADSFRTTPRRLCSHSTASTRPSTAKGKTGGMGVVVLTKEELQRLHQLIAPS